MSFELVIFHFEAPSYLYIPTLFHTLHSIHNHSLNFPKRSSKHPLFKATPTVQSEKTKSQLGRILAWPCRVHRHDCATSTLLVSLVQVVHLVDFSLVFVLPLIYPSQTSIIHHIFLGFSLIVYSLGFKLSLLN